MWVKICGITRLEDAVSAARFGADAVGFVFAPSPRRVSTEQAARIARQMPAGPARVGVFVNESLERVQEVIEMCGLDMVQLHGDEPSEYCRALNGKAIKALRVNGSLDMVRATEYSVDGGCAALLLDGYDPEKRGGTGKTFDWKIVHLIGGKPRLIVAGGLTPANVGSAVRIARPYGVDVSSGVEKEPGVKDAVLMYKFIEQARKADYEVNEA